MILTGDIKHNPTADLLIVTTENSSESLFQDQKIRGLYLISTLTWKMNCSASLDEVHYIDDADRGTVWEQTVLLWITCLS